MTEVTGIQGDGDQYQVETSRGVIIASRVLIAAGGWSAHVARLIDVNLPIRGAPLQMLTTETAPPMIPCLISHADRHLTMKQTKAGTILIGGAWMAATGKNGQPLVLPESLEGNSWVATHTVPSIGGLSIIRSWAAMNIDIDGAPLLGPLPGHPGVFIAATANGYTLGPLIGREAADLCLSKHTKKELEFFSTNRFLT
jgi:glycine/D-amino acid oxidase-like deaminating enzyme